MNVGRIVRQRVFGTPAPAFNGGRVSKLATKIDFNPYHDPSFKSVGGLPFETLQSHPYRSADDDMDLSTYWQDTRAVGTPGKNGAIAFREAPATEPASAWLSARPFIPAIITKTSLGVGYEGEEIEVRTDYFNYNNDVMILATDETRKTFTNWQGRVVDRTPELLVELGRRRQFFDFWWNLFSAKLYFPRSVVGLHYKTTRQPFVGNLLQPISKDDISRELWHRHRIIADPSRLFFYPPEDNVAWTSESRAVWYIFPDGVGEGCAEAVLDTEKVKIELIVQPNRNPGLYNHGWMTARTWNPEPYESTHWAAHEEENWRKEHGPPDSDHLNTFDFMEGYRSRRTADFHMRGAPKQEAPGGWYRWGERPKMSAKSVSRNR